MKRFFSLFLSVLICASAVCFAMPLTASAEDSVGHNHSYYINNIVRSQDGTRIESFGLMCEGCYEVVQETGIVIDYRIDHNGWGANDKTSWYFIDGLVTLHDPVRIYGTVNLVLLNDSLLQCMSGIQVENDSTLNIYSERVDYSPNSLDNHMGKLRAYTDNDNHGAAIGGMENRTNVTVSIYGGDIMADAKGWGAAIGSGYGWFTKGADATVNIHGGKIIAFANNGGAAIGCGYGNTEATVNVYGGIAWAQATECIAASVGKSYDGSAAVNYYGGFIYGAPLSVYRYDGIVANSITKYGNARIIGNNDGLYDDKSMALAKTANWIEQNGGYIGSTLSEGNMWIIIPVAVVALAGIASLIIIKRRKKMCQSSSKTTER
ncbi:MAG: hypothetical protein MJ101_06655 [Clostridia bacterium]|nr:hypothetical protein [Clostridia bacterium]